MSEYPYELLVGRFTFDFSNELPAELVSLFTEADRARPAKSSTDDPCYDEGDTTPAAYEVTVPIMRRRLEIMGFTNTQWQEEIGHFAEGQVEYALGRRDRCEPNTLEWIREQRKLLILQRSSPKRWMKKLVTLLDSVLNGAIGAPEDTLKWAMYDPKMVSIEPIFTRQLIFLRGALEVVDDEDIVTFLFSNAVFADTVAAEDRLSDEGRDQLLRPVREFERILILPEGRTDARLLRSSLARIRPEIAHMYSFMDHEAFKAEGGVPALVSLARSLAAAGISNRIVFLFDNDTAGHEGLLRFLRERLPAHYKAITLPYLKFAETYPTIGPTGDALANINECACGIELYCGPKALTKEDGQFCPIQWTGYNAGMKRYQGEPLDKDGIKKRFLEILEVSACPAQDLELESMRLVLSAITELQWR